MHLKLDEQLMPVLVIQMSVYGRLSGSKPCIKIKAPVT